MTNGRRQTTLRPSFFSGRIDRHSGLTLVNDWFIASGHFSAATYIPPVMRKLRSLWTASEVS